MKPINFMLLYGFELILSPTLMVSLSAPIINILLSKKFFKEPKLLTFLFANIFIIIRQPIIGNTDKKVASRSTAREYAKYEIKYVVVEENKKVITNVKNNKD